MWFQFYTKNVALDHFRTKHIQMVVVFIGSK